jgi:hypothetical protein
MAESVDGYTVYRLNDAYKYSDSNDYDWSSNFFLLRRSLSKSR